MTRSLSLFLVFVIMVSLTLVHNLSSVSATASSLLVQDTADDGWRSFTTDVITVRFPADGRKPMFLWWYTKDPEKIYAVKFDGLREYFAFNSSYYTHQLEAEGLKFKELLEDELFHSTGLFQMSEIRDLIRLKADVNSIITGWGHPAYLPFDKCRWTLQAVSNLTADDDKVIGLTFTFNLTRALPFFNFAENNVAIRVRVYNTAVTESVKDSAGVVMYSYSVGAGEMKIDFIVENWRWNLDWVQPFLTMLQEDGVSVPQTQTSLALEINLATINRNRLHDLDDTTFLAFAITRQMFIENRVVNLLKNLIDDIELPLKIAKDLKAHIKLTFAADNQSFAGFFKFIASAMVTNSQGSSQVPVTASYRVHGASLKLFISYPYFKGTLFHDPSVGVDTPETTTPAAITPSYQVSVGTTTPTSAHLIAPQILSRQVILLLVVGATLLTLAMLYARSKGRSMLLHSF